MLRPITDLWPNLLRPGGAEQSEEEEPLLASQEDEPDDDDAIQVDERQIIEEYRNLCWTRVVSVQNFSADQDRKWPLGPDIVEECQAVAALPPVDPDGWVPLFEPTEFTRAHQPLLVEDYRL